MTKWAPIIDEARVWVEAQAPYPVTLRQCFYHLVADQKIENSVYSYKRLSALTATARYEGTFPDFADETRPIERRLSWDGIAAFAPVAAGLFGLDRTEGQKFQVVVAVEKRGMLPAVSRLFGERGWTLIALAGYSSVTAKQDLSQKLKRDPRPSVLLYAGDLDASGEGILTDFAGDWDGFGATSDHPVGFTEVHKVALDVEQVLARNLPMGVGKMDSMGEATDTRAARFNRKYRALIDSGQFRENFQVEVDALPPAELNQLLIDAAAPFWDTSQYEEVAQRETELRDRIATALNATARPS
jgi:hypothetical protein